MAILAIVFDKDVGRFLAQHIGADQLQNQAIVSAKLGAGAVGTPHLALQAITSALVAAGILATPHLLNQGILSASLGAGAIGGAHVADQGLLSANYASGSIGSSHLGFSPGGLTAPILSASIGAGAIGGAHVADQGLLSANYAGGSIGGAHVANQGILSASYASGQIAWPHIANGAVLSAHIASGVLFDATVPVTQASADVAATGTAFTTARRDHKHGMPTLAPDVSAAKFITAQAEAGLSAEVNLGALTTGLLKHAVAAGVSTPATATKGTDYVIASTGSYSGNNGVNRAIPHGLGVTPKIVFIIPSSMFNYIFRIYSGLSFVYSWNQTELKNRAVTAMDSTNFYVGISSFMEQAANGNGITYNWVAIG